MCSGPHLGGSCSIIRAPGLDVAIGLGSGLRLSVDSTCDGTWRYNDPDSGQAQDRLGHRLGHRIRPFKLSI